MADRVRLYFASDVHGSERCFRKFLGAAKFYRADVLIMGGDITGKAMVPIIEVAPGRHQARFHGRIQEIDDAGLDEFERFVRFDGFYPYRCDPEEYRRLEQDEAHRTEVFNGLMAGQIRTWMALAKERLEPAGVRCFVMPGNDDEWVIDEALASDFVVNPEGRVVDVDGMQMLSSCWTNRTPWDSPREEDERDLATRLEKLAEELDPGRRWIFNLHCPPHGTTLDLAPKMTADLEVVMVGTQPLMESVGSKAVRELIERYQPLVSFHGHIHESRAIERIGRTLAINPGSRYSEGVLDGVVLEVKGDKITQCQLVVG
jgi:Icc-related predicted phosphoesterase